MAKNGTKLTVLDPIGQPTGIFGRRLDPDSPPSAIHDPVNQPRDTAEALEKLTMASRLDSLDGKTLYLVNTGFHGSKEFLEEVHDWFNRNRPGVKTVLRDKKTSMFMDEPELWAEIRQNADGAVLGVGG